MPGKLLHEDEARSIFKNYTKVVGGEICTEDHVASFLSVGNIILN